MAGPLGMLAPQVKHEAMPKHKNAVICLTLLHIHTMLAKRCLLQAMHSGCVCHSFAFGPLVVAGVQPKQSKSKVFLTVLVCDSHEGSLLLAASASSSESGCKAQQLPCAALSDCPGP